MSRKALIILALLVLPILFIAGMITLESGGINATNLNFILGLTLGAGIVVVTSVALFAVTFFDWGASRQKRESREQDSDGA